jgi:cell division septum initiation protein DivIVA
VAFGTERILDAVQALDNALQQRLTGTITAAEQIRQDTANAITTGLAELRNDNHQLRRELLNAINTGITAVQTENRDLRNRLDYVTTELADTRQQIEAMQREAAQAQAAATRPARPFLEADTDDTEHETLLGLAAGVAYAEIVCHRDTWAFLVEQAARHPHFRLPAAVGEEDDGRIEADLSGRALIAALEALWETRQPGASPAGTRHLAEQVYGRISAALGRVEPGSASGQDVTRVVIDDRPRAAPADEVDPAG